MDVGRLIDCVREHEYLYDICHREYKNFGLKAATWELFARELNESSETCKLKWKTVRDGYIKYKKQLISAEGSGKKINDYIWSSRLKFLDNYYETRNNSYKTPVYRKTDSAPVKLEQLDGSQSQDESASTVSQSPPPLVAFASYRTSPDAGQSSIHSNKDVRNQILDQDSFRTYAAKKDSKNYDATDHLFLCYSQTFKTFSLRQQALLKIELAKLFANAELEQLKIAEDSGVKAAEDCSVVIVKTEFNGGDIQSPILLNDVDAMEVIPAKRPRRGATSRRQ